MPVSDNDILTVSKMAFFRPSERVKTSRELSLHALMIDFGCWAK